MANVELRPQAKDESTEDYVLRVLDNHSDKINKVNETMHIVVIVLLIMVAGILVDVLLSKKQKDETSPINIVLTSR